MQPSPDEIVRTVIARHMQVAPATITRRTHLLRELELDPLDLVLIALRLEEILGVEFPIERLEEARIVADLSRVVQSLVAKQPDETEFTLDEPRYKRAVGA